MQWAGQGTKLWRRDFKTRSGGASIAWLGAF